MKKVDVNKKSPDFSPRAIAFCAVSAALGTAVMLLGGLIPVFTYCSPLIAALFLIPVLDVYGKKCGWATWTVTAALSLLIGADKEAAFFYIFFSWYPLVKPGLDRIGAKPLRIAAKVLIFSAAAAAMFLLTCYVLGIEEIQASYSATMWINVAFLAAMVLCMLLFDRALNGFIRLFRERLRDKIH